MRGERAEGDTMPRRRGGRGAAKNGRREGCGAGARIAGFAISAFPSFGFDATVGRKGPGGWEGRNVSRRVGRMGRIGAPSEKGSRFVKCQFYTIKAHFSPTATLENVCFSLESQSWCGGSFRQRNVHYHSQIIKIIKVFPAWRSPDLHFVEMQQTIRIAGSITRFPGPFTVGVDKTPDGRDGRWILIVMMMPNM